jgi:hypothetical protein
MTSIVADRLCGSIPITTRPMRYVSSPRTQWTNVEGGQRYFELGKPLT